MIKNNEIVKYDDSYYITLDDDFLNKRKIYAWIVENDEGIIRIRVFDDENITSSENILYKVNHKVKMVNNDVLLHIPIHGVVQNWVDKK